jgi:bifunctional oligoribonuclease and PAP phosphatase NrnA
MLSSIASRLKEGSKLILIHGNADPDALGSAYAIYRSFPGADIVAPGGLDRISKVIAENLGICVGDDADPKDYDTVLILDTSSPDQLEWTEELPSDCIVVDHHARSPRWEGHLYYCDDTKKSCAEIVLQLLKIAGVGLDHEVGLALLAGMLTDSGHFRYANPDLLCAFADLMTVSHVEIDQVFALTDLDQDISERIAQLKGAQRLRFDRVGDFIVAVSHGSSFESSVCKSLLGLGADVAFVGSQREDKFRVSARSRQEMVRKGLHLGRMLESMGMETQTDGGGHAAAAGLIGEGDVEAILSICMQKTMAFFRENK